MLVSRVSLLTIKGVGRLNKGKHSVNFIFKTHQSYQSSDAELICIMSMDASDAFFGGKVVSPEWANR